MGGRAKARDLATPLPVTSALTGDAPKGHSGLPSLALSQREQKKKKKMFGNEGKSATQITRYLEERPNHLRHGKGSIRLILKENQS